jgi:cysteine sulfinate desulfinase/cysteine desulfurase-like protein
VLVAMGLAREWLFGALRLTFGLDNLDADVDGLLEIIPALVAQARPKILAATV